MGKILLVEDDFYVRQLYRLAFEKKGYTVVGVEDGQKALDCLSGDSFDFIVLDLMLPGVSGLEVLKKAKADTGVPVYVLTNVGDEEILSEAVANEADAYFLKVDYTPRQLVETIEAKRNLASRSASAAPPKS